MAAGNLQADGPSQERVMSVDVLRGFDMFWIVGGAGIVETFHEFGSNPVNAFFVNQLRHRDWEGFVFEDFIFPLFVFLVGMSVVFSVGKIVQREGKAGAYRRIFRRFVILFALGVLGGSHLSDGLDGIRLLGVPPARWPCVTSPRPSCSAIANPGTCWPPVPPC